MIKEQEYKIKILNEADETFATSQNKLDTKLEETKIGSYLFHESRF